MLYQEAAAPEDLQPFATHFWFIRAQPQARYEKILPGPSAHLILNLSAPYRLITPAVDAGPATSTAVAAGFYAGLQRSYLISENPDRLFNVGVRLAPFGLPAFTGLPPSEVQGRVVDAEDLFPGFTQLQTRLEEASPDQAFSALADFLRSRLRRGYRADARTVRVTETLAGRDMEIAALARDAGISWSTLERIMARDCGVTAKAYSDVCRFYRFVNQAAALPKGAALGSELLQLADYYDQPHLIRTFRRFSGFTPTEYLRVVQGYGPEYATFVPMESVPAV
ncbi:DUF6597 domain-containing transcriptional factor [Paenarthrobacter sp. NyZ202]|uniref:DUF6597 domain-containing transcriptional factor n=1 Tax=Paenarthrobacter sp. NyZ202 TaxID=3402689 RepID=UPI003CEDA1BD